VKHLAALLCLSACFSGCLSPNERTGDPPSTAAAAVSLKDLGEALAKRIESGDPMTTQHAYKLAQVALKDAGLMFDLGPVPKNEPLTDESRKELAAKFRAMK
jgi:hypothetical protein